jgi:hypothetical protein
MARYYRENGFESVGLVANIQTSGTIINAPGTGYSIYLLGASCFGTQRLQENSATGNVIINIGSGFANFPSTVKVKQNTSVYGVSSTAISTIFYYIDKP